MKQTKKLVLFDLDGTLFDSAPDLHDALSILLKQHDQPALDYKLSRSLCSLGARTLINYGFNQQLSEQHVAKLLPDYLAIYQKQITKHSMLFDGIDLMLANLNKRNIPWGVVTNKRGHLANDILEYYKLLNTCKVLISAEDLNARKPLPDSIILACKECKVAAEDTIYVGDNLIDIEAGRNAHTTTIAVTYGYHQDHDQPNTWQADFLANNPEELSLILKKLT